MVVPSGRAFRGWCCLPKPAAPELGAVGPFPKPDLRSSINVEVCVFCWYPFWQLLLSLGTPDPAAHLAWTPLSPLCSCFSPPASPGGSCVAACLWMPGSFFPLAHLKERWFENVPKLLGQPLFPPCSLVLLGTGGRTACPLAE